MAVIIFNAIFLLFASAAILETRLISLSSTSGRILFKLLSLYVLVVPLIDMSILYLMNPHSEEGLFASNLALFYLAAIPSAILLLVMLPFKKPRILRRLHLLAVGVYFVAAAYTLFVYL